MLGAAAVACGDSDSASDEDAGGNNACELDEPCSDESGEADEPSSGSVTGAEAGASESNDGPDAAGGPMPSSLSQDAGPGPTDQMSSPDAPNQGRDDAGSVQADESMSTSDPSLNSDSSSAPPDAGTEVTITDEPVGSDPTSDTDASTASADAAPPPIDSVPPFEGNPIKVDLLLVVDNSISMGDKQEMFTYALPDLVERLVSPYCTNAEGENIAVSSSDTCPAGYQREFSPVTDLHLAVITTSLGAYGAQLDCDASSMSESPEGKDMAHLLATLPRGAAAVPSAADSGFLSWTSGADEDTLVNDFSSLITTAGEHGCGWEAPLEAWTRFLVDPVPYTKIVRQPCNSQDTANSCAGPETDENGELVVDEVLLQQRAGFLRNDSLVTIVMLTDENDCSFVPSGQSWRLSQSAAADASGALAYYPAFRGTAACNSPEYGPNHQCCHSCGQASIPDTCPAALDANQQTVALGCENGRKFSVDDLGDHGNLRCFEQKRRFGLDYLFPVERYVTALNEELICITAKDLSLEGCPDGAIRRNALFGVENDQRRPEDWLLLVGVVGVPWQDLAIDPMGEEPLRYRSNDPSAPEGERIDWSWLLADEQNAQPGDPLMIESVSARTGTNPATGEAVAPVGAGYLANAINGHEWNIADESDLQYACTFPIAPVQCPTKQEAEEARDNGELIPNCDCTDYPGDEWSNPLCQAENGSFDDTQRFAKAYPGLRELRVLRALGKNGIVASICPKETDPEQPDFGYRPAVDAMIDRFRDVLGTSEDP